MARNFKELLEGQWSKGNFVCAGLDPDPDLRKLPEPRRFRHTEYAAQTLTGEVSKFLLDIVEETCDVVAAYKANSAFFEAHGEEGWRCLRYVIRRIHEIAPDVPVILDAKRADIGNTNIGYVQEFFGEYACNADAVTVHPYLGAEALAPFLDCTDKGVFVLCKTSNKGSGEFQNLAVEVPLERPRGFAPGSDTGGYPAYMRLYQYVAKRVVQEWNRNENCGLVVGATYPEELSEVRKIAPDIPLLIPGIGAQGGDLEATVRAAKGKMLINSSRGIIYASSGRDYAEAAEREATKLHSAIRGCLEKASSV